MVTMNQVHSKVLFQEVEICDRELTDKLLEIGLLKIICSLNRALTADDMAAIEAFCEDPRRIFTAWRASMSRISDADHDLGIGFPEHGMTVITCPGNRECAIGHINPTDDVAMIEPGARTPTCGRMDPENLPCESCDPDDPFCECCSMGLGTDVDPHWTMFDPFEQFFVTEVDDEEFQMVH